MNKKFYKILSFLLIIITTLVSGLLFYFNILPIKYYVIFLIIICTLVIILTKYLNKDTKRRVKVIVSFFSIILILFQSLGFLFGVQALDFLNNIFDTGYKVEVYSLYVSTESTYYETEDLEDKKINLYKESSEGYIEATNKLGDKITFEKHEVNSIVTSVSEVLNQSKDAMFVNESFMDIYKEDHLDEYNKLRLIESFQVLIKTEDSFTSVDITKKPFIVYLSGIDASGNINRTARSDVNLLAVVNPKTHKILLVNTPRDYYVELAGKGAMDKLTHAGIYGIEESALTLGKLYNIDINYYARVNFTSFVNIINALNGIEVDSKYSFSREGYTFKKGINQLNGKAALEFSRERSKLPTGDEARGENQQAVIKGLINKLSDPEILVRYSSILNSLEGGVMTNLDKGTLTKFINMQISDAIKWDISTVNVTGTTLHTTTYSTGSSIVYVMNPDLDSLSEAKISINDVINGI